MSFWERFECNSPPTFYEILFSSYVTIANKLWTAEVKHMGGEELDLELTAAY
jgi:hypothetical protein